MEKCNNTETIKKAYDILDRITPFYRDCGKLCGGICCKGSTTDGMLLFPGEEIFFSDNLNFTVFDDKKYGMKAVSCSGSCKRSNRPIACRIFPYMLYVTEMNGERKLSVAPDIRASVICPILSKGISPTGQFLRELRLLAKLFETDETIMEYLSELTAVLTDFGKFR